ncbi:glycogenin glucosyltransferase [Tilletia horrida]|uniref:Glycogenin glucosyltransferase n=1 Tax=Tilletia horrida TaxID=155126 RepID=A0AAN6G3K3_9BASI|nr:glycogenin glucosyltransferase [Tilletia horrida]
MAAPAQPKRFAFVTLLTSDHYLPGALVVAHSLREAHRQTTQQDASSQFDIVCLVTPHSVRVQTIKALCASSAFDRVLGVEPLGFEGLIHGALAQSQSQSQSQSSRSGTSGSGASSSGLHASQSTQQLARAEEGLQSASAEAAGGSGDTQAISQQTSTDELKQTLLRRVKQNLQLLGRPDLGPRRGAPLSKLHAWRLTQYEKVVFLDADTLVLQPLSHLFHLATNFAAAPDIGWPDAFNSGVLVLKPSLDTFSRIRSFAAETGSWDGADQGLLNEFYGGERGRGEDGPGGGWDRLSFKYNVTPNGGYTFAPAYRRFGSGIQVAHFIGEHKPWHRPRPSPRSGPAGSGQRGGPAAADEMAARIVTNDYETLVGRWHDVFSRYYPLPSTVDRHSSSAYSVEVIHSSRGVEIVERETGAAAQSGAAGFEVPTYEAVWNAHNQDNLSSFQPGHTDDLRSLFAGGAALYGLSTETQELSRAANVEAGLGKYVSFPLDGRTSLIPPEGLPGDLLAIFAREEHEAEEQRRVAAEEAQRASAALAAQMSHPEGRVPAPPSDEHHQEHAAASAGAEIARPWSPPKMSWDPAREPPPTSAQDTTFSMPAHYDNAWDVRHGSSGPAGSGAASGWQRSNSDADAQVAAARVPQHLMQGMYSHLANQPPDASKVRAVFPWEQTRASGSGGGLRGNFGSAAGPAERERQRADSLQRRRKIQAHAAEVLNRLAEQRAAEAAAAREAQERGLAALGDFDGKPLRRATRVFPDDPPRTKYAFQGAGARARAGGEGFAPPLSSQTAAGVAGVDPFDHRAAGGPGDNHSWMSNAPALSAIAAEAEAASAESMAVSPPAYRRGLPPTLGYSNAWDHVGAIGEYADTVQAAQSPGPGGPVQLLSAQSSAEFDRKGLRGVLAATLGGKAGKMRARSRDRRSESGRRSGGGGGALGMVDMGEYAGSGGSAEGEDSRDGDDESSSEDEHSGDEAGRLPKQQRNGRQEQPASASVSASASTSGPGGYGYGGSGSNGAGGAGAPAEGGAMVVGALGLTDDQFPEVLNVIERYPDAQDVLLLDPAAAAAAAAAAMVAAPAPGSTSPLPRNRRRAESRGYLRKAEATAKAQMTASPRSPRNHGVRASGGSSSSWGYLGGGGDQGGGSPGGGGGGGGVGGSSVRSPTLTAGEYSQSPTGSSTTTTSAGMGGLGDAAAAAAAAAAAGDAPLSGRARIRPMP